MGDAEIHPYHWQWLPTPAPPPSEKVHMTFISGLPEDVKEMELQNLPRWLLGYKASHVNFKGEHPMDSTLFFTLQLAVYSLVVLSLFFGSVKI